MGWLDRFRKKGNGQKPEPYEQIPVIPESFRTQTPGGREPLKPGQVEKMFTDAVKQAQELGAKQQQNNPFGRR